MSRLVGWKEIEKERDEDRAYLATHIFLIGSEAQRPFALGRMDAFVDVRAINLFHSLTRDIGGIRSFPRLTSLNLSRAPVVDISPLADLGGTLTSLELNGTSIADVSVLASLPNLEWLGMSMMPALEDRTLLSLGGLEKLKFLDLAGSTLAPEAWTVVRRFRLLARLEVKNTVLEAIAVFHADEFFPHLAWINGDEVRIPVKEDEVNKGRIF